MVNGTLRMRAKRLGEERLPAAGGAEQEDVRLLQLDAGRSCAPRSAL